MRLAAACDWLEVSLSSFLVTIAWFLYFFLYKYHFWKIFECVDVGFGCHFCCLWVFSLYFFCYLRKRWSHFSFVYFYFIGAGKTLFSSFSNSLCLVVILALAHPAQFSIDCVHISFFQHISESVKDLPMYPLFVHIFPITHFLLLFQPQPVTAWVYQPHFSFETTTFYQNQWQLWWFSGLKQCIVGGCNMLFSVQTGPKLVVIQFNFLKDSILAG